jgi:hypothetical protein
MEWAWSTHAPLDRDNCRASFNVLRAVAMPAGGGAQLVEGPALINVAQPRIAGRCRLRHGLALTHRSIASARTEPTLTSPAGALYSAVSGEATKIAPRASS